MSNFDFPKKDNFRHLNVWLFSTIVCAGGVLFFIWPRTGVSLDERRRLAPFPVFSFANLWNGSYLDSIDTYYSDNFIFRDGLIAFTKSAEYYRGLHTSEIELYADNSVSELHSDDLAADSADTNTAPPDSTELDTTSVVADFKSVLVYKKKAIQIFCGSKKFTSRYVKVLEKYRQQLGSLVNIYCLPVPVGSDFYIPDSYSKDYHKEKDNIEFMRTLVSPDIRLINVYDELKEHTDEYIQFNTDHHWTGRGAYYAYRSFCKTAGITPLPADSFHIRFIPGFVGSMYSYTKSKDLLENADSVEYFKLKCKTKAVAWPEGAEKSIGASLFAENAKGINAYSVFLGSDYPLMKITSPVANKKKILVIKDSYGNAFSPFLCNHFEEVYIVDYRYFNGSVPELIRKYGITDLLFAHNLFVISNKYTAYRENLMLKPVGNQRKAIKKSDG